ncbi:uncharacterized protein Nmlp_3789 [Natronomonas moolapensis 8.8.11]|uniref:Uncharacterized protein n=1 Tax=Natronomonas moolapensis (strain DSM 18674 / CECT 7526 / JCM 14361 / 8.8.11) TaxID=268739 RepID=M1XTQ0_NATM8|nr:hypothetical protein [Natronomonas moolapensis]CCQ37902.1 uncharacterized protein Nmlp_3789 [Natronomonas moolapensis 8.8.11]
MIVRKHPDARCPHCGSPLYYGLKSEPTGWTARYDCTAAEGCGREFTVGRIDRASVESEDGAYERARQFGDEIYKR